ncbi:hypothetical protein A2715_05705 [Candidatus Woesebacteria bacterium RIFCSPHIGHO2_01_FULL_39_32]|uniref:Uncharacterized protein n=1 Tax=Candidatus Woesebacteria bacterium RIFCSPLOWO2_01_FULL_39_25 TaxID=1802521 RepID=A0A1F8BLV9_9BACT|nr:MAG: hypothetical protein A2124_04150 [Candidatus Woesebacteria bacterium GWB1_37_5]OGM25513.1 MAG: hypothetical protein A2715_05705 [Candidatus Woesebacteria bacterium RIFCSPHIGHO2_01_FULL_39_32]OGM36793.1 MAG: hypothetical protein A3F01_00175 [Candidatus Woesebacteria bacterium RIFCSPHIGHO2_12_FULL_38_11]OGM65044.1 MAG: hypothetical protein A2893_05315 [Candidatus Woesebacteria bacterium RIFCSPLOWO2_01_FULL_39_25]
MEAPKLRQIDNVDGSGVFWVVIFQGRISYTTKILRCGHCHKISDYLIYENNSNNKQSKGVLLCTKKECVDWGSDWRKDKKAEMLGVKFLNDI